MQLKSLTGGLTLAAALWLTPMLVAQSNSNNNAKTAQKDQSSKTNASDNSNALSSNDKDFLQKLAQEDTAEIKLAHLALKKSSDPMVQKYAHSILSADPAMRKQAKSIAQSENAKLMTNANAEGLAEYQKLSQLSGKQFDKEYIEYEAQQQSTDLDLVKGEINSTTNTKVKDYATAQETPVRKASDKANQLAAQKGLPASQNAQNQSPKKH